MSILVEQADRAAIVEALAHHVGTCRRIPRHHVERLAFLHRRIDALLDDLELLGWDLPHEQTINSRMEGPNS